MNGTTKMTRNTWMIRILWIALLGIIPLQAFQPPPPPWVKPANPGYFLLPEAIDPTVLPAPPPRGSLAEQADLETLRMVQAWRTPEQEAWAKDVDEYSVWKAGAPMGPWFTAANLPQTATFFWKLSVDSHAISGRMKALFNRPRPPKVDEQIRPCVPLPTNASYPSGHSIEAFLSAEVISDLCPEYRDALIQQAHRAAWARIQGGVHYPTDDVGGRIVAQAIMVQLRKVPAYGKALEECRAEMLPYLAKAKP